MRIWFVKIGVDTAAKGPRKGVKTGTISKARIVMLGMGLDCTGLGRLRVGSRVAPRGVSSATCRACIELRRIRGDAVS